MNCFNPGWIKRIFQDLTAQRRLKSHQKAQLGGTNQQALSEDAQPLISTKKTKKAFTSSLPGLKSSLTFSISSSFESSTQEDSPYSIKRPEVVNPGPVPDLACIMITSFGDSPPSDVVEKKKSSFLKGVGIDFDHIQDLIDRDNHKFTAKVMLSCHFKPETAEACKKAIKQKMDSIKLEKSQKGLLIYYSGHGQKDTGSWPLKGSYLTFDDIYQMYKMHFKGRYLYIVTDCCYSGSWVVECARLLDKDGLKCSHAAKKHDVYINIFAASLPDQPAYDTFYSKQKGVKLHRQHLGDDHTIKFAEHRKLGKEKNTQTTLGVDFTHDNNMCIVYEDETCYHCCFTWTEYVQKLCESHRSVNYLI